MACEFEDIASGYWPRRLEDVAPGGVSDRSDFLMSDESIGNNTDHRTPNTIVSNSSMLEVNLAQVKVPSVRLFAKEVRTSSSITITPMVVKLA